MNLQYPKEHKPTNNIGIFVSFNPLVITPSSNTVRFHPIPLGGGYVLLLSRCSYSRTRDSAQNSVSQHRFPANSILHKNQLTLIINNQPTISALFYPNALIAAGRKFHKNNRLIFPSHFHSGYFWVFLFHLF